MNDAELRSNPAESPLQRLGRLPPDGRDDVDVEVPHGADPAAPEALLDIVGGTLTRQFSSTASRWDKTFERGANLPRS